MLVGPCLGGGALAGETRGELAFAFLDGCELGLESLHTSRCVEALIQRDRRRVVCSLPLVDVQLLTARPRTLELRVQARHGLLNGLALEGSGLVQLAGSKLVGTTHDARRDRRRRVLGTPTHRTRAADRQTACQLGGHPRDPPFAQILMAVAEVLGPLRGLCEEDTCLDELLGEDYGLLSRREPGLGSIDRHPPGVALCGHGPGFGQQTQRPLSSRGEVGVCLLYTSPSPRDGLLARMPSS